MAEERKKGGYRERFVTTRNDLEVYCMPIVPHGEQRGGGINGNHEKNANDTAIRLVEFSKAGKVYLTVSAHRASCSGSHA